MWCKGIEPGSKQDRMGMQGAFFVLMGGFTVREYVIDGADESSGGDSGGGGGGAAGETYYTSALTARGFKRFVNSNRIAENAFDKGKASNLAKMLVFVQTTWFVAQCIARKAACLPITLLEIHVAIQVACAVVSSLFWWHKPLDVDQPINIAVDQYHPFFDWPSARTESSKFAKHDVVTERTRSGFLRTFFRALYDLLANGSGPGGKNMIIMGLLILFNGACHLLAWNNEFPTPLERRLWLFSAMAICGGILIYAVVVATGCYENRFVCAVWELRFYDRRHRSGSTSSLESHLWTRLRWEREQICRGGDVAEDSYGVLGYESGVEALPSHQMGQGDYEGALVKRKRQNSRVRYVLECILFGLSWVLAGGYFLCIGYVFDGGELSVSEGSSGGGVFDAALDRLLAALRLRWGRVG